MRLSRAQAKALGIPVPNGKQRHANIKDPHGKPIDTTKLKWDGQTGCDLLFDALCLQHGLPRPVHEFQFAPPRKFLADYCFDAWLLVEKDGGLYGRGEKCATCGRRAPGAHSSIGQMKSDREKDRLAILLGYAIVRFLPEEFEDGSAFPLIKAILESREEQP